MKAKFRLVKIGRRGGTYYIVDRDAGERQSLNTKGKAEAAELLTARSEAHRDPALNLLKARVYLAASDPEMATRTWGFVMEDITKDKTGPTLRRYQTRRFTGATAPSTRSWDATAANCGPDLLPLPLSLWPN